MRGRTTCCISRSPLQREEGALAGAALAMAGLFAVAGDDVGPTWTKPLFG
ncbi:hypothetical protein ACL02R_22485 [Streptomyces sp. MS19]